MEDDGAVILLSVLFDGGAGNQECEWLDDRCVNTSCAELFAGALLLKAMERVARQEWGRQVGRPHN